MLSSVVPFFTVLMPWEFSPTLALVCAFFGICYARGSRQAAIQGDLNFWRNLSFWSGLLIIYAVLQTHFDYYAQHMFWIHRLQHLILHHIGPFLLILSYPGKNLLLGLPQPLQKKMLVLQYHPVLKKIYALMQMPLLAAILFVGVIFFWLAPQIHLIAMLNYKLYNIMNWSMVVDGLLFWRIILDARSPLNSNSLSYNKRLFLLWLIMPPQIILGAYIALSTIEIYSVYDICGRAWSMSPIVDQRYAGLMTWIPASMMSAIAALVVIRLWRQQYHLRSLTQESAT